ncbi:Hypp7080 [Branchiostoma lanceolatum]|uniref:Hypp7078 protein n=1 Tax=Branchiostoma lanceolatum TaxID=7740 RepID=A0A8K0E915_BRALA|nr:Hypp7078 [Branchiostoma lanceolatum]CAH1243378.1 Hypp7080 [Branchiostoma lanceolatum]
MSSTDFYLNPLPDDFREKLRAKLQKKSVSTETGCRLWTGYIENGGRGYGSLKVPSHVEEGRVTLQVHRLAYFVEVNIRLTPSIHVSHLCGVKACVNVDHLSYEPAVVNSQRNTCFAAGQCFSHGPYRACLLLQ